MLNLFRLLCLLVSILMLQSCGGAGGGDGNGEPANSEVSPADPRPFTSESRFLASTYDGFVSSNDEGDISGVWVALVRGTKEYGSLAGVNGNSYKELDDFEARYTVRLVRGVEDNKFLIYTCGAPHADVITIESDVQSTRMAFFIDPIIDYMTTLIDVIDAETMHIALKRNWARVGTNGMALAYDLEMDFMKISDDPMHSIGTVSDNQTAEIHDVGCFYEARGSFIATQDDSSVSDFEKAGDFNEVVVFPSREFKETAGKITSIFRFDVQWGYQRMYKRGGYGLPPEYHTSKGDTVDLAMQTNERFSSYQIEAARTNGTVDLITMEFDF